MLKRALRTFVNNIGFEVSRYRPPLEANLGIDEHLGFELEEEAMECISIVRKNTMLSKRRLVTLYQQVQYCERYAVPGAFVECGVWKGGAMGMMALANLHAAKTRRPLHLFDAFQEICEPDASVDGERALREVRQFTGRSGHDQGLLRPLTGIYDFMGGPGALQDSRNLLEEVIGYPPGDVHFHVGWFQDTLPMVAPEVGAIAILRLDGDWYASTKICLEQLFDQVVRGGVVIIDDYGTYDGCRRAVDEFVQARGVQAYLGSIDSDCRFFIKQ